MSRYGLLLLAYILMCVALTMACANNILFITRPGATVLRLRLAVGLVLVQVASIGFLVAAVTR